jgi:KDO2-lipid IV(A) lauroyltransferase
LRAGGAFAILPDVRMRQPDLTVPFLGAEANLGRGMALFARTAGVPILPVLVTRVGWGRQRFEPRPPVHPDPSADKESDALRMTRTVMAHIDKAIRNDPGQWFWYNKRWVLEPVAAGEAVPVLPPDAGGAPA